jgi:rod shape-determining protein MreC
MTSLLATRTARRRGIAFTVLLVITVFLMAFSSNPAVREVQSGIGFAFKPIQGALDQVAAGVSSVMTAIAEIDRLRVDNAALKADNERLKAENARLEEIRRENEQLTALLQLRAGLDFKTTAATVIARESSEFRRLITLDKGTADGVKVGDVATARGGSLVGRVTEVGPDSSTVLLLTDTGSTVIGQLTSNAGVGEVVGQLSGELVMKQIQSNVTINPGDEVVTAGIELGGGIRSPFPKGLLIGQVIDFDRDANDVVQTAFLQPAADLDQLEYVLVITDYQGGLPPIDQQPEDCGSGPTLPQGEQPCFSPSPRPAASKAPTARPPSPKPTAKP